LLRRFAGSSIGWEPLFCVVQGYLDGSLKSLPANCALTTWLWTCPFGLVSAMEYWLL
jgi:hypothetical protein